MRKIDGYVCIAKIGNFEVLFGVNTSGDGRKSEVFSMNDLTPFPTLREAHAAGRELQKRRDVTGVSFGRIRMQLATTDEEIYAMKHRKSLVVVRMDHQFRMTLLIGALISEDDAQGRGPRYPLCGEELRDNGIVPFPDFKPAIWTAKEEARQSGSTSMAIFSFKRLKPLRGK